MTTTALRIELPLPDKRLHPNAAKPMSKGGHIGLNKTKGKARTDAKFAALGAMYRAFGGDCVAPRWKRATIRADFRFKLNRGRDEDNLIAWLKHYIDGIADAGVIENDVGLTWEAVTVDHRCVRSCVVLEISPLGPSEG